MVRYAKFPANLEVMMTVAKMHLNADLDGAAINKPRAPFDRASVGLRSLRVLWEHD